MTPRRSPTLVCEHQQYEMMKEWYLDVLEAEIGVETSQPQRVLPAD